MVLDLQLLSPVPAYLFGIAFIGVGLQSFIHPVAAYDLFGIPVASSSPDKAHPAASGAVSPFVYAKAARDISVGLAYFTLQSSSNALAVTAFSAAITVTGFLDGWIVWRRGGDALRKKAWNHWIGSTAMLLWIVLRVLKHRRD